MKRKITVLMATIVLTFSIMGCDSAALTESKNNATVTKRRKNK